jgi:hypothetical protein
MRSSCEGAHRAHDEHTLPHVSLHDFQCYKRANSPSKFPSAAQSRQKRSIRGLIE